MKTPNAMCSFGRRTNVLGRRRREAFGSFRSAAFFSTDVKESDDAETEEQSATEEKSVEEEETKPLTVEDQLAVANERVEALESELEEQKDKVLRAYAEMENVRMITSRDVKNAREYSIQSFAKGLLDVSDNLQRALDSVGDANVDENPMLKTLLEGVDMTEKELTKTFNKNGVKQFGEVGDDFDPNFHDALFRYQDANLEPGKVGQVIKTGFMFKDRVLRPAQVGCVQAAE